MEENVEGSIKAFENAAQKAMEMGLLDQAAMIMVVAELLNREGFENEEALAKALSEMQSPKRAQLSSIKPTSPPAPAPRQQNPQAGIVRAFRPLRPNPS